MRPSQNNSWKRLQQISNNLKSNEKEIAVSLDKSLPGKDCDDSSDSANVEESMDVDEGAQGSGTTDRSIDREGDDQADANPLLVKKEEDKEEPPKRRSSRNRRS